MKKVSFAIIGAGGIGHAYAQAFDQCSQAELTDVVDMDLTTVHKFSQCYGGRTHDSIASLLASGQRPEAAVVCTPPNVHADLSCQLMENGVHVLCEKPLSIDPSSAQRMLDSSAKHDRLLTMASKFRCVEDVNLGKEILESGKIGELVLFENSFTSFVSMSSRWNADPTISGGGVLIDNGTHSLDIARFFMGPIREVQVIEGKRVQGLPVDETVTIFVRNKEGTMGRMDLSWTINKNVPDYITLHGTGGTVSIGWKSSAYRVGGGAWIQFGSGYDKIAAFAKQLDNFALAMRGEQELLIKAEDGFASVVAVKVAYESLRKNNWVRVDPSAVSTPGVAAEKAAV